MFSFYFFLDGLCTGKKSFALTASGYAVGYLMLSTVVTALSIQIGSTPHPMPVTTGMTTYTTPFRFRDLEVNLDFVTGILGMGADPIHLIFLPKKLWSFLSHLRSKLMP